MVGDTADTSISHGGPLQSVDKAWAVGSASYVGSGTRVDWLLTVVTDEARRVGSSVRRARDPVWGTSALMGQLRAVEAAAGKLFMRTDCAGVNGLIRQK